MANIATVKQALDAVKQDYFALKDVPKQFKTPSVCLEALRQNRIVIDCIPENLRELIDAVERIEDLPAEMTDEDICLMAIEFAECTLSDVPEAYRTLDICITAIEQGNSPIEDVPEHLRAKVEKLMPDDDFEMQDAIYRNDNFH
ncbi:MAG: DUF4116 domain-containing protein [Fibromonadaceae bacterium]|jgi:hypothetical protein|nr:DUF4116 domain-containing protein [Fibromonadaceae bacterium]